MQLPPRCKQKGNREKKRIPFSVRNEGTQKVTEKEIPKGTDSKVPVRQEVKETCLQLTQRIPTWMQMKVGGRRVEEERERGDTLCIQAHRQSRWRKTW